MGEKIKEGEIACIMLVKVIESFHAVSGLAFVLLECKDGVIEIGSILVSKENKWRVSKSNLLFGREKDFQLQQTIKDNKWYLYQIEPLFDSLHLPEVKSGLNVIFQER